MNLFELPALTETTLNDVFKKASKEEQAEVFELVRKLFAIRDKMIGAQPLGIPHMKDFVNSKPSVQELKALLQKYLKMGLGPVFGQKTGMPYYDDMMKNQRYALSKGVHFKVVRMSPDAYLRKAKYGFLLTKERGDFKPEQNLVKQYADRMLKGEKAPLPVLKYTMGKSKGEVVDFSQEGRHRAEAANYLGLRDMPVLVMTTPQYIDMKDSKEYAEFVKRWIPSD